MGQDTLLKYWRLRIKKLEDLEWIMSDYLYGDTVSALERKETPFSFLLKRRKGISVQEIKKEEDLEIDDLV